MHRVPGSGSCVRASPLLKSPKPARCSHHPLPIIKLEFARILVRFCRSPPSQLAPLQGALDFPDEIIFDHTIVKDTNTKTFLVQNVGQKATTFQMYTQPPFAITPTFGSLEVGEMLQCTTSFNPSVTGVLRGEVFIRYDSKIFSPSPRFIPAMGIFSLPFCDWCPLWVYSRSPSMIGAHYGSILSPLL
eukprot:9494305-Pyramimonas_sp.AAC.2